MSDYIEMMDRIQRERVTETWVRSVDTVDIVEKLHELEDLISKLDQDIADRDGAIRRLEGGER